MRSLAEILEEEDVVTLQRTAPSRVRSKKVACETRTTRSPWIWGRPGRANARGPLSLAVFKAISSRTGSLGPVGLSSRLDTITDGDFQLALYWSLAVQRRCDGLRTSENDDQLGPFRELMQSAFLEQLREESRCTPAISSFDATQTKALIGDAKNSAILGYLGAQGTLDQLREFFVHRSVQCVDGCANSLNINDRPSNTASARRAVSKSAQQMVLSVEHEANLAAVFDTLDLDPSRGAYVARVPGVTLAAVNFATIWRRRAVHTDPFMGPDLVFTQACEESWRTLPDTFARFGMILPSHQPPGGWGPSQDPVHPSNRETSRQSPSHGARPDEDALFGVIGALYLEHELNVELLHAWTRHESSLIEWTESPAFPAGY